MHRQPPHWALPATGVERLAPAGARGRGRPTTPLWALTTLGLLSCAALSASCWASGHLQADPALLLAARFLHLVALVVGLGAVLAVDWLAVLWMLGRRRLTELLHTVSALQIPIWLGLTGLVASGALLRPDLASPLTRLKLALVLAVTVNGLFAHRLGQRLARYGDARVPRRLCFRAGLAAAVSQIGWWGASLIGFLNAHS